jgi:Domain of unknown function (DUF4349)
MTQWRRRPFLALALVLVLPVSHAACGFTDRAATPDRPAPAAAPPEEQKAAVARAVAGPARPAPDLLAARKLIRNGQLTLEVRDYGEAADRIAAVARSRGGYVADGQSARGEHDRRQGVLTLRVPAEHFEEAVAALKGLGRLLAESVSVQDVTRAYMDLETRLRVKRDTEGRLRDILRTRTAKLSDVLEAERELARVAEEIEGMEGERRYYDQQVAMSTIAVTLREPAPVLQSGVLQTSGEALRDSVRLLAASAAVLLYATFALLPWLAVLAPAALVMRTLRRRRVTSGGTRGGPA